jgi:hypothetical protein
MLNSNKFKKKKIFFQKVLAKASGTIDLANLMYSA